MKIDNLSISTHPRTSWQSFDLGCRMAIQWWKPLASFWLMVTLPAFVIVNLISIDFAMLILWVFKPWFERGLLYIYSRQVFGEQVTALQALQAWWTQIKPLWFSSITWRRLSPSRAFDAPVAQLEGLTGDRRQQRLAVLHRTSDDNTTWWMMICVHWELFIVVALVALLTMLIPQGIDFQISDLVYEADPLLSFAYNLMLFIAWWLVAPFFVGGSFAAYLNRRIILEGWDIELTFKQFALSQAIKKTAVLLVVCILGYTAMPPKVMAKADETQTAFEHTTEPKPSVEQDRTLPEKYQQTKTDIDKILSEEPFFVEQVETQWQWNGWTWEWQPEQENQQKTDLSWLTAIVSFIASVAEILLWGIALLLLATLLWLTRDHIARLLRYRPKAKVTEVQMPSFTKAYSRETLPSDMYAEIERLTESESYRQLLSLLLTSSIIELSKENELALTESMTERECLAVICKQLSGERSIYMQRLVETWISLAWAHQWPSVEKMRELGAQWLDLFRASEEAQL